MTVSENPERLKREKDFHNKTFGGEHRNVVQKFYGVVGSSWRYYEGRLNRISPGTQTLEYGCGPGSYALFMAGLDARVTGIDISETAIQLACNRVAAGSERAPRFCVMDAEVLGFSDQSFDLVCGRAILHHLHLDRSLAEISRVLRQAGTAIFVEPLGHNPLINLYRKITPNLRTVDEHPLLTSDLADIRRRFPHARFRYFHCLSLASVLWRNLPGGQACLRLLDALDQQMFRMLPFTRKYAWTVVIEMSNQCESSV